MLTAPGGGAMLPFLDAFGQFHPYSLDGARRKNATRETTAPLKVHSTKGHNLEDTVVSPSLSLATSVSLPLILGRPFPTVPHALLHKAA